MDGTFFSQSSLWPYVCLFLSLASHCVLLVRLLGKYVGKHTHLLHTWLSDHWHHLTCLHHWKTSSHSHTHLHLHRRTYAGHERLRHHSRQNCSWKDREVPSTILLLLHSHSLLHLDLNLNLLLFQLLYSPFDTSDHPPNWGAIGKTGI